MSALGQEQTFRDYPPNVRFWGQSRHNSTLPSKNSIIRSSSMKKEKDHVYLREKDSSECALEQGQTDRTKTTASAEARMGDTNQVTSRYLGIEVDDALEIAEKVDI